MLPRRPKVPEIVFRYLEISTAGYAAIAGIRVSLEFYETLTEKPWLLRDGVEDEAVGGNHDSERQDVHEHDGRGTVEPLLPDRRVFTPRTSGHQPVPDPGPNLTLTRVTPNPMFLPDRGVFAPPDIWTRASTLPNLTLTPVTANPNAPARSTCICRASSYRTVKRNHTFETETFIIWRRDRNDGLQVEAKTTILALRPRQTFGIKLSRHLYPPHLRSPRQLFSLVSRLWHPCQLEAKVL